MVQLSKNFTVDLCLSDVEGETISQIVHGHDTIDGAAQAFGHAVTALQQHYRDKRQHREALQRAEAEKRKQEPLTADDFLPPRLRQDLIQEHGGDDAEHREAVDEILNHVHRLIRERLEHRA